MIRKLSSVYVLAHSGFGAMFWRYIYIYLYIRTQYLGCLNPFWPSLCNLKIVPMIPLEILFLPLILLKDSFHFYFAYEFSNVIRKTVPEIPTATKAKILGIFRRVQKSFWSQFLFFILVCELYNNSWSSK